MRAMLLNLINFAVLMICLVAGNYLTEGDFLLKSPYYFSGAIIGAVFCYVIFRYFRV